MAAPRVDVCHRCADIAPDLRRATQLSGDAINRRQYIALQDYIAVVAIVYVLVNVAVDMLYRVLDPRIRGARIG